MTRSRLSEKGNLATAEGAYNHGHSGYVPRAQRRDVALSRGLEGTQRGSAKARQGRHKARAAECQIDASFFLFGVNLASFRRSSFGHARWQLVDVPPDGELAAGRHGVFIHKVHEWLGDGTRSGIPLRPSYGLLLIVNLVMRTDLAYRMMPLHGWLLLRNPEGRSTV